MANIINKLQQILSFRCGLTPNANDFASLINSTVGVLTNPLQLPSASAEVENTVYKIGDIFYTCTRNSDGGFSWVQSSATGGVTSYNELENKPRINNVVLGGNRTAEELGVLRDNGGYTFVRPESRDIIPLIRAGTPFQSRVSDLISSLTVEEVVILEDITHTPPVITDATIGRTRYFNTLDNLIYVADTIATWNPQGVSAVNGVLYVNRADNSLHWFDGTDMQSISSGGGGTVSKWLSGDGTPPNNLGNIGDWYINTINYNIYEKTGAKTWTLQGNIRGQGVPDGGDAFDILIKGNDNKPKWLKGYSELDGTTDEIEVNTYAVKTVVNYTNSSNVLDLIIGTLFEDLQDMNIVIFNNRSADLKVSISGNIEWKDGNDVLEIKAGKTGEISLMPYKIVSDIKIRGIKN